MRKGAAGLNHVTAFFSKTLLCFGGYDLWRAVRYEAMISSLCSRTRLNQLLKNISGESILKIMLEYHVTIGS